MSPIGVEVRGAQAVQETLKRLPLELRAARREALKKSSQVISKFWRLYLSGPAGHNRLGVGTGQLRRSIRVRLERDKARVGTNMPYARVHEFGFDGAQSVRGHAVRSYTRSDGATVRAHFRSGFVRQMHLPRRPHRRPALKKSVPFVRRIYAGEMDDAIRDAKAAGDRLGGAQKRLGRLLGPSARRTR